MEDIGEGLIPGHPLVKSDVIQDEVLAIKAVVDVGLYLGGRIDHEVVVGLTQGV